ncbi:hypothetical protein [Arthrobacter sp. JSM 101049]|uniref:hypothetical protein n=1 Tax=Arthrobacter sp. JSM 101049 TaxID=929097 RepID=UPI00356AF24A
MTDQNFGFYFEAAGKAATQGAISPAAQFFEGSRAETSLVRETGQNSIDAGAGAVKIVFELADMPTDDIPGIAGLRTHLAQVEEQTRGSQGHDNMELANETSLRTSIPVLRISDYGTKGLAGTESINDPKSPLSALTRGAGISADDGSRGGSFGIGSAVGPMASDMSTVLYTSLPLGGNEVVFAGYSCLASHRDTEGIWRVGDGFFTDRAHAEDFRYLRDPEPIGPFPKRTDAGTDLYILGYRKAEEDPTLQHIKVAFMRNFLMAIHRGELVVEGKTPIGTWRLDAEKLKTHVAEDQETAAFYRAITDPNPILGTHDMLGQISLYINVDDSLSKSLHTIAVRKPLMKIDTFKHTSIPVKYAAVLECSDEKGNTLLRKLEPPQHHKWDAGRSPGGGKIISDLKTFVRNGLKSRVKEQIGEQVHVKGLSKYLPDELFEERTLTEAAPAGTPGTGSGTTRESSTVQGRAGEDMSASASGRKAVSVRVKTSAGGEGSSPAEKGKDAGGGKKRNNKGGNIAGGGTEGDGTGRISAGDIRFRSWSDATTGDVCLALTSPEDISGDVQLLALGPGGSVEEDYELPIDNASIITAGVTTPLKHKGNILAQLELKAGTTSQVRLKLSSNHRYRLGIK